MTPLVLAVVLNELMIDPTAAPDTTAEWIELFNDGTSAVDLSGWSLRSGGDPGYTFPPLGAPKIPAGAYVVLGRTTLRAQNGDTPVGWAYGTGIALSDDSDWLVLARPGGATEAIVDYGLGWPHVPGRTLALGSLDLDAVLPESWCRGETVYGAGDRGTPNGPNDCTPVTPDGGPPAPDAGAGPIYVVGKVEGGVGCDCGAALVPLPLVWPLRRRRSTRVRASRGALAHDERLE